MCLIDTLPLLGVRLMVSLAASDFVVTPVSVGLYELAGVADLMQTIHVIRTQGFNPRLRRVGILPMKTNNRSTEEREVLARCATAGSAILPKSCPSVRRFARRLPSAARCGLPLGGRRPPRRPPRNGARSVNPCLGGSANDRQEDRSQDQDQRPEGT